MNELTPIPLTPGQMPRVLEIAIHTAISNRGSVSTKMRQQNLLRSMAFTIVNVPVRINRSGVRVLNQIF